MPLSGLTFTPTGYLHDATTGAAIAGATVTLYPHADANPVAGSVGSTTTDANGKFSIAGITVAQLDVKITNGSQTYWWKGLLTPTLGETYISRLVIRTGDDTVVSNVPVLLYQPTITAGVTALATFDTLPTQYKHLQIRGQARMSASGSPFSELLLRVNDDATSSYELEGAVVSTSMQIGQVPTASATAGYASSYIIDIANYGDTNLFKSIQCSATVYNGANVSLAHRVCIWKSASAITKVEVARFTGATFAAGTSWELWGIP